jgi:hypothetical protein
VEVGLEGCGVWGAGELDPVARMKMRATRMARSENATTRAAMRARVGCGRWGSRSGMGCIISDRTLYRGREILKIGSWIAGGILRAI